MAAARTGHDTGSSGRATRAPASEVSDGQEPDLLHPEQVDRGLAALALHDGSERAAARFLEQTGKPIPFRTLHDWKTTRAERYAEVREQELPAIRRRHIHETEELYGQALALKRKLLAKVDQELDQLTPGQAANALKQVGISAGIDTDKALLLRGEPTVIHGNVGRDMDQLWNG